MQSKTLLILGFAALAAGALAVGCSQSPATPRHGNISPPPDLNTVEECQRADLGRYWGKTFRFHLYDCWANVSFDTSGKVLTFEADDVALCERVLDACRPR